MAKFYLKVKAQLTNVTQLEPVDTPESPYEYTFKIECTKCREVHGKPVTINRYEQHEITGSRGEASFVFRCKSCKSEHSAQIMRTKHAVMLEDENTWVSLLEIDARGIDFLEYLPEGRWQCKSALSATVFNEVDLEDGEWYDYDDVKGEEVSVTEVEWDISRS